MLGLDLHESIKCAEGLKVTRSRNSALGIVALLLEALLPLGGRVHLLSDTKTSASSTVMLVTTVLRK